MNFNYFYNRIISKKNEEVLVIFFFILFLALGLYIVKDYGISTDEPFQRTTGYFWYLNLIEKFSSNSELINSIQTKFNGMYWSNEIYSGQYQQYGALFDLFSAFIEELLKIKDTKNAFLTKHILTFLIFFISSIFFYKIITDRFKSKLFAIIITIFYVSSPRIFADSFYNCKDIVFMCFCVFSLYFCFKSLNEYKIKNILYFSLFSALATDIRIMGILLFTLFFIFFMLNCLERKNFFFKNYKKLAVIFFSYPIFVYLFWPFLWEQPIQNFLISFKSFSNYDWGSSVFYLGSYIKANNLPWHYVIVWIISTTPIIFLIYFFIGFIKILYQLCNNFLNISEEDKIWTTVNEQKDFFIILFFIISIFSVIFFNSTLYSGWRHLYFIYPCLIYLLAVGLNYIFSIKIKRLNKNIILVVTFIFLIFNFYNVMKFHPYQNVYFNLLVEKKANKLFEIDYWGLGNREAINYLYKVDKNNSKITIRTASFTPLFYSKLIIEDEVNKAINLSGSKQANQTYIFTNYIYDKNPKYEKKYFIPQNYSKFFTLKKGNITINEIFKKD